MSAKPENDDDSFIIVLSSSPGSSLNIEKCNEAVNDDLERSQIEDAMKALSVEANMAFKAQFSLGDSPSPASMMVASTLVTDDRSTEELQQRFGELLDENVVLKETLKQNNDSMKEQFMLIASCQDDMLKTHKIHKEKFDKTRELVEKLRQENKQLKLELTRATGGEVTINSETGESKSGASSGVEFVSSPDDDTIDKLTAQLELVEKQRREIIVDNEKLTWQKESLEHIIDATSKERDLAKEKLKNVELQLSNKDNDHSQELQKLHFIINDLQSILQASSSNVSSDEVSKRDSYIQQLEGKITCLQNELKKAQIKIMDLENIKLEFTQHKSSTAETVKMYKEEIQELNNRIKEVQKTVFQPVRFSISSESESVPEYANYMANVKLYDRTLKHLADYLNTLINGLSDSLVHALGALASLQEGEPRGARAALAGVRRALQRQHAAAAANIAQVRGTLTIFEGIFKDYNEVLKKSVSKTESSQGVSQGVSQLTAALLARERDLAAARALLADCDLLRAQLHAYRSDFEAERESRERLAGEKENVMIDLRNAQRKIEELTTQMEEIRIISPSVHKSVTTKNASQSRPTSAQSRPAPAASASTGNMVYTCPKCMRFSSDQYKVMEDHFDFCLDDF